MGPRMKPRIASYYESRLQRNDGNPLYVTQVFKRDYADTVQYDHLIPDPSAFHDVLGAYDRHLWIDWAEDALQSNGLLPYRCMPCPRPAAYWASDTHLGYQHRMETAKRMDWVFVAQQEAVERFRADGVTSPVEWFPHAVEPDVYNPGGVYAGTPERRAQAAAMRPLKSHDVGFVGFLTFPSRIQFLDAVFRDVVRMGRQPWYAIRFFEDAAKVYSRSRIVLNHAVQGDVNMRVFEALATRSFLLTPAVPGLSDLFQDGVHLATYEDGNVADCLEKIRDWLDREDEREAIAEAGYRAVLERHTFAHRVARLLHVMGLELPLPPGVTAFDAQVPMAALVAA
jgi:glycosyltransferase involved in cell wall biosynthesis